MTTNDHTVPQMYLRRFAELRPGRGHYLTAAPVDDLNRAFTPSTRNVGAVQGFYWGTDPSGVDHHEMELLLGKIEGAAVPAFRAILDDKEAALPRAWPLSPVNRLALSWWIAAQVLRTTRQRARLESLDEGDELDAPTEVGRYAKNNAHLAYISHQLAGLSKIVFEKPWCVGFSDTCLLTGDVPVIVLNGQDDPDQSFAIWLDEVYLPLDPHRFLLLPGHQLQAEDPSKRVDHRDKMDGGMGLFFNDAIWAAADRHVFYHPDHDPIPHMTRINSRGPRLPAPGTGTGEPRYSMSYGVLPADLNVERRWLVEHPPPRAEESPTA